MRYRGSRRIQSRWVAPRRVAPKVTPRYQGNTSNGNARRTTPVRDERQEAVRSYRGRTAPVQTKSASEPAKAALKGPYTGPNNAYPYPLNYRYGIAPDEYEPRLLQRMPPGQGGMPTMDDIWAMYGLAKSSEYYPAFTPRIFDAKRNYDQLYQGQINRVASMYSPAYSNRGNIKADAMNTVRPVMRKGYHGLGNVRRIRQEIYNKSLGNEAQGITDLGGNEGGNGWSDWGGGGGGGYNYANSGFQQGGGSQYPNNAYAEYRQGQALQGTSAPQSYGMRTAPQSYANSQYATQNGARRWLQLLTNWRI